MTDKLQEEKQLSADDIIQKVKKLDIFIKRAERRLALHEKKLAKVREGLKSEIKLVKGRVLA